MSTNEQPLKVKEVRLCHFLDKSNINNLRRHCETFKISIIKRKGERRREVDYKTMYTISTYFTLEKFEALLKKMQEKFDETKNMNTRESINHVRKMKNQLVSFLNPNPTGEVK
jgi:hypothetical protein